ncbi:hypothetical protein DDB_G0283735 [Dictyostelium discoideum AX4]|uniref:Mitochondrial import inner membrane translocase subunit TIM14 n=1 Tax=Dictyostelium discoideum TaxID=44689 RepID=TIM14_DICDI|nr:hypothetical protein DDB_G0283735 [Dictyostelium discoideum AX4]Q54QN1.1 RecName: Full=Mitochondrial import inner membrane translocase subunit TIM14; AltName: Full=DnaJ homolog subfamily C member 19 [Dictyostelium discoideum]EAL65634.1 hypothetical protein DDB_G0283735 [Dictyostelium discoideum AX4]|eukprot:XP_638992.1 hypothetical protein DDB_G0283735 [Dictyostelium discoideum AX4]
MATPIIVGATIAGIAYSSRFLIRVIQRAKSKQLFEMVSTPGFTVETIEDGFENKMTPAEAANILGLKEESTKEEIKIRHKLLMIKNHPDKGGSSYLATKINEARNVLSSKNSN